MLLGARIELAAVSDGRLRISVEPRSVQALKVWWSSGHQAVVMWCAPWTPSALLTTVPLMDVENPWIEIVRALCKIRSKVAAQRTASVGRQATRGVDQSADHPKRYVPNFLLRFEARLADADSPRRCNTQSTPLK